MQKILPPIVFAASVLAAPTLADRIAAHARSPQLAPGQAMGEEVSFSNGAIALKGFLYKPKGAGPFPALIWNHGSEPKPGWQPELAAFYNSEPMPGWQPELAAFYNSQGFVFFIPHRHGQGRSPGEYIVDVNNRLLEKYKGNQAEAWKQMVALHDVYNTDVAAAVEWLKSQLFVDKNRIIMSGVYPVRSRRHVVEDDPAARAPAQSGGQRQSAHLFAAGRERLQHRTE